MATTISTLREGVKGVASHMEDMAHHAEQTNASFTSMLKALLVSQGAAYAFGQSFKTFIEGQPAIAALKTSLSTLAASRTGLVAAHKAALDGLLALEASADASTEAGKAEHTRLEHVLKVSELQLKVKDTLLETSGVTKVWLAALVGGLAGARAYSVKLNQDLIEANSNLGYRFTLMQKSLEVQRLTGESFEDITAAAAALVHYGMDESETFKDNLKYVTMLKEGIGLSAQTSGMLAAIWERQLGQSFKRAADTLAQIVNSTSLAADEAGRLATNIAKAVGAMRVGVSSDLAAVVKLVAGYENELKKMGGEAGAFGELLTKMTRQEGMVGASVLGIQNPEFLASEQASKAVLKRFGTYVNGFLAGTQGWERTLRLESLSELFGMSADQINLMARAVKAHTGDVQDSISIEERYREQVVSVGRSWATLGNKLKAVLFEAVTPLLEVLAGAIDVVTKFVGLLAEWKGTVYIVMTALVASLPFVIREIGLLTAALFRLALAARASALASLSGAAGGAGGLLAGLRGALRSLPRLIAVALTPFTLGLSALAARVAALSSLGGAGLLAGLRGALMSLPRLIAARVAALSSLGGAGLLAGLRGALMSLPRLIAARVAALSSLGGGAAGLRGALMSLPRLIAGALVPFTLGLSLILAEIVAFVAIGVSDWSAMRRAQKEAAEGKASYRAKEEELLAHRMLKVYLAARRGDSADLDAQKKRAMNFANEKAGTVYNGVAMTEPEVNKLKAQISSQVVGVVRRAQVTQLLSQQSFVTTPKEAEVASRQEELTQETLKSHNRLVEEFRAQNRNITRTADEQDKQRIFERERWGDEKQIGVWDVLKLVE